MTTPREDAIAALPRYYHTPGTGDPDPDGEWVRYADLAALAPADPTADLRAALERVEKNYKSLRVAAQRVLDDWNRVGAQGDGYRDLRAALAAEADRGTCGNCHHDPDIHSPVNRELCAVPGCDCPGLLTAAEADRATPRRTVIAHNHGPHDGPGLSCREYPVGECQRVLDLDSPEAAEALARAIAVVNLRTRTRTPDGEPMLDDGFEWYASPREMAADILAAWRETGR